jgi:ketol-acid reductoisomerase
MVARGVPAKNAYFETVAQLPQLAALLASAGPDGFWHEISDCAAAGSAQAAPRLFGREFDARLRALWDQIESGRFARHLQRQGRPAKPPASWQVLRDIEAAAKKRGGRKGPPRESG